MSSSTETRAAVAAPVPLTERISIIDSLRGFAILGILLMNISSFGLPDVIEWDPSVLSENGLDFKTWFAMAWLPEGTQRALFSMLFGAGIILFTSRQEQKLDGVRPADYFIRRQLWLIVFSLFDVYILLWQGDILFDYAVYGIIMYAFRKLPAKKLIIAASVSMLLMFLNENRDLYINRATIHRGELVAAIDTSKVKLTKRQEGQLEKMEAAKKRSKHETKVSKVEPAIDAITGTYEELYDARTGHYQDNLIGYTYLTPWDVLTFMLLGMAFFKMGILTGKAPIKVYWWLCIGGFAIGLSLSYYLIHQVMIHHFNWYEITKDTRLRFWDFARCMRTLGILGLLMLLYRSGLFGWLFQLMRPVGQMAFTNYLAQSILCGLYFNGNGLGMYGKLARHEIYYVVAIVWIIQIIWSHVWLRYFRFGPMEWCWRSLTYWKAQPFRRRAADAISH